MNAIQIRSTAAAFLTALSTPDVFTAWVDVRKDDKRAVGKFIAQTLGLAKSPSGQELLAIESSVLELTGQAPTANAPRHVGFAYVQQDAPTPHHVGFIAAMQQAGAETPRHVGMGYIQQDAPDPNAPRSNGFFLTQQAAATLNNDQRRAVAVGFLGALASPAVFHAWTAVPKTDRTAVAEFVRDAIGLAETPSEADLGAIEALVQEVLAAQTVEVRAPRSVGFMYAAQQAPAKTQRLTEAQLHGIAAAFLDTLKSTPSVFEAWIATPKNDTAAIGKLIAKTLGLATAPTADELEIMANYVDAALKTQVDTLVKQDTRVPRHVGMMFLVQQASDSVSISDADLRELLELSQLTSGS